MVIRQGDVTEHVGRLPVHLLERILEGIDIVLDR